MGKNKKWKRKAKRIKGTCIYRTKNIASSCKECIVDKKGYCDCIIVNSNNSPYITSIRTIERICKYGR